MNPASDIRTFVIIGAGRVAYHFAHALRDHGFDILQVIDIRQAPAEELASALQCGFAVSAEEIRKDADAYLFAVPDDALDDISNTLAFPEKIVMHTSGGRPAEILRRVSSRYGVLYPLQTLRKEQTIDFSEIPLLVEGSCESAEKAILGIAASLSGRASVMHSEERAKLHLAAVFACNFSNHLFAKSYAWCRKNGLDFSLLFPLIRRTCENALQGDPAEKQTGPAVRGDEGVIGKHLELLQESPELKELYTFITQSIQKDYEEL